MRQHICRWAMLTQSGARWIRLSVKTLRAHVLARIGDLRRYKGELWIALLGAGVKKESLELGPQLQPLCARSTRNISLDCDNRSK